MNKWQREINKVVAFDVKISDKVFHSVRIECRKALKGCKFNIKQFRDYKNWNKQSVMMLKSFRDCLKV